MNTQNFSISLQQSFPFTALIFAQSHQLPSTYYTNTYYMFIHHQANITYILISQQERFENNRKEKKPRKS